MRKLFLLTLIIIYLKGFSQAPGEGNCWTPDNSAIRLLKK
jgi:hypothetical protein